MTNAIVPASERWRGDATDLGFLVWTSVHGIADLANSHPRLPWPDLDAMVTDTQRALGLVRPATT